MSAPPRRKSLGQHFLHDAQVIDRIVAAVAPSPGESILEIGPGDGAITLPVLAAVGRLTAVEQDPDRLPGLRDRAAGLGTLRLIHGDALKFELPAEEAPWRIVGNLPYNCSTPLLFHFLDQLDQVRDLTVMLQKEVVDRMGAAPGSKAYGRLSVAIQQRCAVEPLFRVRPGAFTPPPEVLSTVVRLIPRPEPEAVGDPGCYHELLRRAFGQRRKTLRNALKGFAGPEGLARAGIEPAQRAEELSVSDFARLSRQLSDPSLALNRTPEPEKR